MVYCAVNILLCIESLHQAINHWALLYLQEWGIWPLTLTSILFICIALCIFYAFSTPIVTESICVHFLFILYYRTCIIERTVTSLLFHVPAFTLCLLVVRSTSPCRQDHERTNVSVSVLSPLKKNGLSVRNIGKLQVAFLFAVLLFMSIYLSVPSLALSGFGLVKLYMDLPLRINKPKQREGILHCYKLEITQ